MYSYDLAVIGGGSGGFGAALAAARRGLNVLLVEAGPMVGGNSTLGGVNTWEPGIGGPGFHGELFERLRRIPNAIGLSVTAKHYEAERPWGFSRITSGRTYRDSLRRSGVAGDFLTRVTFEPDSMAQEMALMLAETGNATVKFGTRFVSAETDGRRVTHLKLQHGDEMETVAVRFVVDATAQIVVARSLSCQTYLGCEPRSLYEEPGAPSTHIDRLNGVSLIFRVTPTAVPQIEPLPSGVPNEPFLQTIAMGEYPNGDLNMNALPIMQGWEWHEMEPKQARQECEHRVYRLWNTFQCRFGFDGYRLSHIFPFTGVREGPRLVGRFVLSELDVRAGVSRQRLADRFITIADHALDVHGEGWMCGELEEPYGVPYECLLPKEFDNLAVACRGASFSHVAAASCRLSRTMMQLGHATGLAAALALKNGCDFPGADVGQIREWLAEDNVGLSPDDTRFGAAPTF